MISGWWFWIPSETLPVLSTKDKRSEEWSHYSIVQPISSANTIEGQPSWKTDWTTRATLTGHSLTPLCKLHRAVSCQPTLNFGRQDRLYRAFQEFMEFFPWIKPKLTSCESDELEGIFKEVGNYSVQFLCLTCSSCGKVLMGLAATTLLALKKRLWTGFVTSTVPLSRLFRPPWNLTVVWSTTWQVAFSALSNMIGMTPSKRSVSHAHMRLMIVRVRKNIRERHPQFLVTEDSWPKFLYDTQHTYDPDNIEKGLFRSTLLLRVRAPLAEWELGCTLNMVLGFQAYLHHSVLSSGGFRWWTPWDSKCLPRETRVLIRRQEYTISRCLPHRYGYYQATGNRLCCGSGTITFQMKNMPVATDKWNCSFGLHCLTSHTGGWLIMISTLMAFITVSLIISKLPLGQLQKCESMNCCSGGTGTIPGLTF